MIPEGIPAVRGIAQAEADDHLLVHAPVRQVFQSPAVLPFHQTLVEEPCRFPVHLQDAHPALAGAVLGGVLGHGQSGFFRQELHRLDILEVLGPHDKADGIAAGSAAEAVEGLALGVDHKGRGLFRMEGTEPFEIASRSFEQDIGGNQRFDVTPLFEFLQKTIRYHGAASFLPDQSCQNFGISSSSHSDTA